MYTAGTSTLTTYYFPSTTLRASAGGSYEVQVQASVTTIRKYYAFAGQTIAMATCTGGTCSAPTYFLTDHLGSIVAVTNASGTLVSQQRYLPFGEVRSIQKDANGNPITITQTDFGYTGQRDVPNLGLMDYRARFYDPYITRFVQPDTITPGGPQGLNRYVYVNNSPVNHADPTGHCPEDDEECRARLYATLPTGGSTGGDNPPPGAPSGVPAAPSPTASGTPTPPVTSTPATTQTIPVNPTESERNEPVSSQNQIDNNPSPLVDTTRLVWGTIIFGGLTIIGLVGIAVGIIATTHDPFGIVLIAVSGAVLMFAVEGLYQTWRPLLPSSWPKHLVMPEFKIP